MNPIFKLKQIETPRIVIRPVQLDDAEPLYTIIQRSLPSLQPWMPWAQEPSLKSVQTYLQQAVEDWKSVRANSFQMIAIHKHDNCIIGGTGYNQSSDINVPYFEIGYWVDIAYTGQGLVTEWVNALTRYAFDDCSAIRVQIRAQETNMKSINVARRCGYQQEAILKHDRVDCVTKKPANGVLWACTDKQQLPPLDISSVTY